MEFFSVTTEQQVRDLLRILPEVIAIDTEYVKGDPRTTELLSVIVADGGRAWAVNPSLLPILAPAIQSRKLIFLQEFNHNDTIILYKHGCDIRDSNCHNLIDMHHLLDENADHDLGSRVLEQFADDYKKEFWSKYENFEDAPEEDALSYQCKDGIYTYTLGKRDYAAIVREDFMGLYESGRQLRRALLDTELDGVPVNVELIRATEEPMRKQIEEYLPKLRETFQDHCELYELHHWAETLEKLKTDKGRANKKRPEPFSFESDKQVAKLLYDEKYLGLPILGFTKKKNPSVDYDTLKLLVEQHPEIQPLLDYKEIKNIYSNFVVGLLNRERGGRIYPSFNISGTVTGRLSHTDPNMGNLPKEGVIRNFFLPNPGMVLIGADYAQLEVVVELNLTDDPGLKEIVVGGASKHDLFKAELDADGFDIPRAQVKNVNFALQYDAQARKIAKMVGCSDKKAERIIEVFYNKFSGVKRVKAETCLLVDRDRYIRNIAGRIRRFTAPKNDYERGKQHRQAYNFLIQGPAGEACNRAFYRYSQWCKENRCGRALWSVHDEIVAECPPERVEEAKAALVRIMEESAADFNFKYSLTAKAYGPLTCWAKT